MSTKKQTSPKGYTLIELMITIMGLVIGFTLLLGCAGGIAYYIWGG